MVFYSGLLFLLLSMLGVREKLMEAISPSMSNGIAIGIGLFIVLIGMDSTHLLLNDPGTGWKLNPRFASPDLIVFFFGLLVTAALHARRSPRVDHFGDHRGHGVLRGVEVRPALSGRARDGLAVGERLDAHDGVHAGP